MKHLPFLLLLTLSLTACNRTSNLVQISGGKTLAEARKEHQTKLVRKVNQMGDGQPTPMPVAPPQIFRTVRYESPVGKLGAYVSPDPKDGKKHPAIIWITGGDCNSIDEIWDPKPATNDQTAAAYRKAGIIMMFPSLRGGNDNPGQREAFYGELDDILAAANFLAQQDYVDPNRIYLGGHSTGGTMALLASEYTDKFRAIFSFGPVEDIRGYGREFIPFEASNEQELALRSPLVWLDSIKKPTFVIEGAQEGNDDSLETMQKASKNPLVRFILVKRANHYSVLARTNQLLANKIVQDTGPTCNIEVTAEEVNALFSR